VPPEKMAVVGLKVRVTGTAYLPTIRSKEEMVKETDATRLKIPPDDTIFDDAGQARFRKLTPTDPLVDGPNVKPPIVMETTADALIKVPEIVITTSEAEVAPHVALKPAMLIAPEAAVGTTEDAKKLAGYERVKALPEVTRKEGEKTSVTGTDDFPDTRSEAAIPKEDNKILKQLTLSQSENALNKEKTDTGVRRLVVEPSPTCARKQHHCHVQPRQHSTDS
jgi:hypothetical protein